MNENEKSETNEDTNPQGINLEHLVVGEVQNSVSIHHKGTDGLETNVFLTNWSVEGLLKDYKMVCEALLERDKPGN